MSSSSFSLQEDLQALEELIHNHNSAK